MSTLQGADPLVPVTVVGGYLGAGKTTLVNRLLAGGHGRRLAVLVNDFGAVNVDADLVAAHDGDTISLQNGCVCCSIADALGDALDRVLALEPPPDQIVIEASGVADPAKVAMYGQGWPGCRLDAVVTLADAETIRARAQDPFVGELVTRQLRHGDVVLLTKVDLLAAPELEGVRRWVAEVAGGAPVVSVVDGAVDPGVILDAQRRPGAVSSVSSDTAHDADDVFASAAIELAAPVRRTDLEQWLAGLPDAVVRAKGFIDVTTPGGAVERCVVQRVGRRSSVEPVAAGRSGAGRLVLIVVRGALGDAELRALRRGPRPRLG